MLMAVWSAHRFKNVIEGFNISHLKGPGNPMRMILKIPVKGMHCSSCEALIKDSLADLKGVRSADASHQKQLVTVDFDEKVLKTAAIKKTIEQAGYEVMT
jgi:copper chaperone CopZ